MLLLSPAYTQGQRWGLPRLQGLPKGRFKLMLVARASLPVAVVLLLVFWNRTIFSECRSWNLLRKFNQSISWRKKETISWFLHLLTPWQHSGWYTLLSWFHIEKEVEIILRELLKLLAATLEPFDFFPSPFDFFLPFVWFLKLVECASLIME